MRTLWLKVQFHAKDDTEGYLLISIAILKKRVFSLRTTDNGEAYSHMSFNCEKCCKEILIEHLDRGLDGLPEEEKTRRSNVDNTPLVFSWWIHRCLHCSQENLASARFSGSVTAAMGSCARPSGCVRKHLMGTGRYASLKPPGKQGALTDYRKSGERSEYEHQGFLLAAGVYQGLLFLALLWAWKE